MPKNTNKTSKFSSFLLYLQYNLIITIHVRLWGSLIIKIVWIEFSHVYCQFLAWKRHNYLWNFLYVCVYFVVFFRVLYIWIEKERKIICLLPFQLFFMLIMKESSHGQKILKEWLLRELSKTRELSQLTIHNRNSDSSPQNSILLFMCRIGARYRIWILWFFSIL